MLRRFRPRPTFANVAALLVLSVALGGVALAATSFVGSDGRIRGCVDKKGHLTVLEPGKHCREGKTEISWNQRGRRGLTGRRGAIGPPGAAGPGAVKINYTRTTSSATSPAATVGPWTVGMSCNITGPFDIRPQVTLYVKGPGTAEYSIVDNFDDGSDMAHPPQPPTTGFAPPLSTSSFVQVAQTGEPTGGAFERIIGDVYLSDGTAVAVVHINIVADNRTSALCRAVGAAIPTT
jgi:hypothetical protein